MGIGKSLWDRLKELPMASSSIYEHSYTSRYCINVGSFTIVDREVHGITNTIKEAMLIRMIHSSIRTWANSSCPTSWMRSYKTPLAIILGNILLVLYNWSTNRPHMRSPNTVHIISMVLHPGGTNFYFWIPVSFRHKLVLSVVSMLR